ncbi:canalicular multispecific organic anion transporter 1-like, partial [Stegodyphus dumicola]|uniref:canalicular multispecific organic anion transporter 1-like n=1 Tax=Stegodyphus dumicola TaxID=202533 RepID=UPI0015A89F61
MDQFCTSEFWNQTLFWDTTTPVFTPCFLKLALIWGPVVFFWIFAPAEIYYLIKNKEKKIPWSALNIAKLVGVFLMMVLTITDMIYQMIRFTKEDVRPVEYYTPFVLFVTM